MRSAAVAGEVPHFALRTSDDPPTTFDLDQGPASRLLSGVAAMSRFRIIVAMLVAVSVAMLPIAGSMAMPANWPEAAVVSADPSAADDMSMSDVCPHHADHADRADGKAMHDAACIAACAAGHIAVPADAASLVVFALLADRVSGPRVSNPYGPLPSNPPFRPPRA